jgi:hypothetical protein
MMRRNVIVERLGSSLQRSPYLWLATTVLSFLLLLSGLAPMAKSPGSGSTTISIVAAGFILYGIAAWVLFPRLTTKRQKVTPSPAATSYVLWTFAATPYLVGWAAVAAGGEQWAVALGFVVSIGLLVATARRMVRDRAVLPS